MDDREQQALREELIAAMQEAYRVADEAEASGLTPEHREALAAPLERARELALRLDGELGPQSHYAAMVEAIERRFVQSKPLDS